MEETANLGQAVVAALASSTASVEDLSGAVLTASEIVEQARTLAQALRGAGIHRDEPVAVFIDNEAHDLVGFLGIWLADGVAIPIHVNTPRAATDALIARVGSRFGVRAARLEHESRDPPQPRELLQGAAIIVFTSGSTGAPKGVVIGHARLLGKLEALSRLLEVSSRDVVAAPLQLTFIFGIWVSLLSLMSGARLILGPKFSADTAGKRFGEVTILAAVPTLLRALCADRAVAPQVRKVLTGGEPFTSALSGALADIVPNAKTFDLYGLTETGSCDFCMHLGIQAPEPRSIGRPTHGVSFRIVSAPAFGLPAGTGELQIRTPYGMLGYLDDSALAQNSFDDGYFRTGDLAIVRSDGLVQLVGRSKDIISRGGNKIAPLEIENIFTGHEAVGAAMAVGMPDERLGESLHLLVVSRGPAPSARVLRDWAKQRIEKFKLPDAIHFVDAIPKGRTGKVDRGEAQRWLRERFAGPL